MGRDIAIGSVEHRDLFCRVFIDTHDPYDPEALPWPELDEAALARLRALPFWDEAISTEREVARKVRALAPREPDPLIREAIALQGFEEARHAALLEHLTRRYGIPVPDAPAAPPAPNVLWDFIRTGYGECFDSFFAFGLFVIARESGFFPAALVHLVEPVLQEEARHILFFVNWIAYRRARQPWGLRPLDLGRSAAAMAAQIWTRIQTARGAKDDDFMLGVHDSLNLGELSPRRFLELCLQEHERRLAPYDPRLLRPRFVPAVARVARRVLRA